MSEWVNEKIKKKNNLAKILISFVFSGALLMGIEGINIFNEKQDEKIELIKHQAIIEANQQLIKEQITHNTFEQKKQYFNFHYVYISEILKKMSQETGIPIYYKASHNYKYSIVGNGITYREELDFIMRSSDGKLEYTTNLSDGSITIIDKK